METPRAKKKILFVITKSNWGGAQRYVYDLATHLPKDEFEAKVIVGGKGILAEKLELAGVPVISIPNLGRDVNVMNDIRVFFELIRLFKAERPDVTHLNSTKIGALGGLAARIARAKNIIFTVHGFAFNEKRGAIEKFFIRIITFLTLLSATKIITLSDRETIQAQAFPSIASKITKIWNGIKLPHFVSKAQSREILAARAGQEIDFFSKKYCIGMIAELTGNKGLPYAIEAMQEREDSALLIIGSGEEHEKLKAMIVEKNLSGKVFLLGFIENASSLAKAFDIFLISSVKEGLPYVLLEVGGAGVPVLTTAVGGIPDIIEDHVNGMLIRPKQSKEIELGLKWMIAHKAERKAFGEKLKADVIEKFNLEKMLEATFALYQK